MIWRKKILRGWQWISRFSSLYKFQTDVLPCTYKLRLKFLRLIDWLFIKNFFRNQEVIILDEIFLPIFICKSIVYVDIFSFVNLSLHTSSFKVIWHTHTHDNYRIPWLDNNESKIYNDNDSCRRRLIELYLHIRNKAEIIWNRGQKNFPSNFCQTSNGASSKIRGSRAWFFPPWDVFCRMSS